MMMMIMMMKYTFKKVVNSLMTDYTSIISAEYCADFANSIKPAVYFSSVTNNSPRPKGKSATCLHDYNELPVDVKQLYWQFFTKDVAILLQSADRPHRSALTGTLQSIKPSYYRSLVIVYSVGQAIPCWNASPADSNPQSLSAVQCFRLAA